MNAKIGSTSACVHIQRSEAVDELLIIPQAYVVSSRVGGWVSPSPEQAAHTFNTHMHNLSHWQFRFSHEIIQPGIE